MVRVKNSHQRILDRIAMARVKNSRQRNKTRASLTHSSFLLTSITHDPHCNSNIFDDRNNYFSTQEALVSRRHFHNLYSD